MLNRIIVFSILIALGLLNVVCAEESRITSIGFSVRYEDGWFAHTDFFEDLSVKGAHISGGDEPFVHMVEDQASKELWAALKKPALKIVNLPIIDLTPDPDPVYVINIKLSEGKVLSYERELGRDYKDKLLDKLSELIQKNERIYSHQKGKPWKIK